jgi:hypothetical protein
MSQQRQMGPLSETLLVAVERMLQRDPGGSLHQSLEGFRPAMEWRATEVRPKAA